MKPAVASEIGGRIRYQGNAADVGAVTVALDGAAAQVADSDVTGRYSFTDLSPGDWAITPRKSGGSANAITVRDAMFVIRASIGLETPNERQRIAADVSGDGTLSAFDAVLILRRVMGETDRFPAAERCGSDWMFFPEPAPHTNRRFTFPSISAVGCVPGSIALRSLVGPADEQNFEAVLFGNPTGGWRPAATVQLGVQVLNTYAHDPQAFTQGLLLHDGRLYESTGLAGPSISSVREVDPPTGQVLRRFNLPAPLFGEGLARVGERLIQLTWQDQVAFVYDLDTFETLGRFGYDTEGWGLCRDGSRLIMSDGTARLFYRDPATFELLGQVPVTLNGEPQAALNELECVGSLVYANVWLTDRIVAIDKDSGVVVAEIDASGLLTPAERLAADVLNGIAYNPDTDTFLITGKLWPKVFEVQLVPDGS